jgi:Ni,Fe-hydrogenase I large subunit
MFETGIYENKSQRIIFPVHDKHHPMKLYGAVEVQLLTFIILVLDVLNGVVHMLAISPSEKATPQHWIEGWVDSRPTLDDGHKIKISVSTRNLTSISPVVQFIVLSLC